MATQIPIHDFSVDTRDSVPFKFIPLNTASSYDITIPHRHNYYEIFFFECGGGIHAIDFEKLPVANYSVHVVSPGQVHMMQRAPASFGHLILFSREFYHLNVEKRSILLDYPFINNNNIVPAMEIIADEFQFFNNIFELLREEIKGGTKGKEKILGTYLQLILLKCNKLFEARYGDVKIENNSLFHELRMLVEQNYRTEHQPGAYAAQLNLAEKKLNDICKEAIGINLSEFIKSRIVLEAKRLLYNTEYSIKEIGYFLGFEDPAYFNRFFKLNTGYTAGDFRKTGNMSSK